MNFVAVLSLGGGGCTVVKYYAVHNGLRAKLPCQRPQNTLVARLNR